MLDQTLLAPYWLSLKLRHAMFDHGIRKSYPCEVPSICIGNITAGGTGKTPHTEMILDLLLESDEWAYRNIAVLSRGHKRSSRGFQQVLRDGTADFCGDEPLQIKKRHMGVTVAVDRNRNEGCRFLCHPDLVQTSKKARKCAHKEFPASDLIVLDDAFQYRKLKADMNILLVDFNRPVCKDRLLPFGGLRDLPSRLNAADVIIVTKCPYLLEDDERKEWAESLGVRDYSASTFAGKTKDGRPVSVLFSCVEYCEPKPLFDISNPRYVYAQKMILFSGIAKDAPLVHYLSDKYKIVSRFKFSDDHKYNWSDMHRILNATKQFPTAAVATTEKDSQRVLDYNGMPDRIRERLRTAEPSEKLVDIMNEAINTTLSRTLLTSLSTIAVLISLIVLGGPSMRDFSITMLLGIFIGTYSSIYIASPVVLYFSEKHNLREEIQKAADAEASV